MKRKQLFLFILIFSLGMTSCSLFETDDQNADNTINNPYGATILSCDDFNDDIILEHTSGNMVDYIINCLVTVDNNVKVTIADGAIVEFTEGSGFIFSQNSTLVFYALPGVVDPVILRGNKNEPGYWKGVHVASDQGSNFILGVEILDAGSKSDPDFYGAITVSGGCQIGNVIVSNSANYGIYFTDDYGTWNSFGEVEITRCDNYPIRIGAQEVWKLGNWSDNIFSDNNPNRIQVIPEEIFSQTRFNYKGIPYEVDGVITASEGGIAIEDGVEIIFKRGSRLIIKTQLTAWATENMPIKLYGHEGSAGSWQGILLDTEGADFWSTIDNVLISDGGEEAFGSGNITLESGELYLRNSRISNSRTCGVRVNLVDGILHETDNVYANNQGGNLCEEN